MALRLRDRVGVTGGVGARERNAVAVPLRLRDADAVARRRDADAVAARVPARVAAVVGGRERDALTLSVPAGVPGGVGGGGSYAHRSPAVTGAPR